MANEEIVLLGCGDMGPVHGAMENYGTHVRPLLATGDIRFGQCERVYSKSAIGPLTPDPNYIRGNRPLDPQLMTVFTDNAFNVVSLAGNHNMDWGPAALMDTIELFNQKGIKTAGAGRNLLEARQPALMEIKGVKVALLAYCSIVIEGYEAGPNKPGIAPLRAHTSYEAAEYQAGMPPRVITVPYEEDLANMVEDIEKAKKSAHVVVVSLHWGLHHVLKMIAEYQPIVAKAAFKAGADLILGHHAHVPKAIESNDGKVCFYSLGNFMFSTNTGLKPGFKERMKRYNITPDLEDAPNCPHGKDSKRSMIAKAILTREGVKKVSFLPAQIDKQLRPEVLKHGDPRFADNLKFLEWSSEDFNHKFTVEGDEVVVTG